MTVHHLLCVPDLCASLPSTFMQQAGPLRAQAILQHSRQTLTLMSTTCTGCTPAAALTWDCHTGRQDPRFDTMLAIQQDPSWVLPLLREHAGPEALRTNEQLLSIVEAVCAVAPMRLKADHVYSVKVSGALDA